MTTLIFLSGFALAALAAITAAITGYRGHVCDARIGYVVPQEVRDDPRLCAQANELIAFWCTGLAILCLPGIALVAQAALADPDSQLRLDQMVMLTLYGFMLACVGSYPFERIKRLGGQRSAR